MTNPRLTAAIFVARPPEDVYDMVADVTRMGEWSPVCKECWWDEGHSGTVGDWFTGRNVTPDKTWETRSEVVAAERGREFTFIVGSTYVRWGYPFEAAAGGTTITETWEFLPDAARLFEQRFGADAPAEIEARTEAARTGMPATLAAIKAAAEAT